jgi:hypothetical protein
MILILLTGPAAGCGVIATECDWVRTIPFGGQPTIDWLLENDRNLLADVVVHNETRERVCR